MSSDFGSVLDDLFAGTAAVHLTDVASEPGPKVVSTVPYVRIGAILLVVFAIVYLMSRLPKAPVVDDDIPDVPTPTVLPLPSKLVKPVEAVIDHNVFSISGPIPIADDDRVEDHKISADKLDPAIEKYLSRE